jgi:flagellar motor protein MotB
VRHLQFTVCETCSAANEQEQARILREQQQRDAEQKAEQEAERRAEQERIRQQQAAQKAKEDAERQAKQEQASHQRAEQARQQAEAKQRRMAEIYHEQAQPRWFAKSHGLKAGYVGDWVLAYGDAPSEDLGLLHGPCVYCVNARKRFSFCIELNEKALFACDQVLKWALVDTKLGIYAKAEPDWPRRERDAVSKLMNGRLDWLANNTQLKRTQSLSIRGLVWILEIVSDDIVLKSIASVEMKTGLLKKETVSENVITVGGKTASVRGKTFGRFGKIFESELPAHFNI